MWVQGYACGGAKFIDILTRLLHIADPRVAPSCLPMCSAGHINARSWNVWPQCKCTACCCTFNQLVWRHTDMHALGEG